MQMRLKNGKTKVLTLSYDDGVVQDIRLIEIMDKHGLKGTFNINSGRYLSEDTVRERFYGRLKLSEAQQLYTNSGHEVAVHALTHPSLEKLDTAEIIYEITEDRKAIERHYGTIARGMAYPYGAYSEKVIDVLEKCQIAYARTVESTYAFRFPENWLKLHPTCHHNYEKLDELIKRFVETPNRFNHPEMFYLWGHSYEFDRHDNWDVIEKFAVYAGGHEHIWYATNIEIYDYVKAYERLQTSYDKRIICNPSSIDVWVDVQGEVYCVKAGETINI
ncbi:MAG: polysaccharide deacetylase family protein [Clostridia bacterium]|nr:polysaccharide deacetylase family protein [Clostridia bacterium]